MASQSPFSGLFPVGLLRASSAPPAFHTENFAQNRNLHERVQTFSNDWLKNSIQQDGCYCSQQVTVNSEGRQTPPMSEAPSPIYSIPHQQKPKKICTARVDLESAHSKSLGIYFYSSSGAKSFFQIDPDYPIKVLKGYSDEACAFVDLTTKATTHKFRFDEIADTALKIRFDS